MSFITKPNLFPLPRTVGHNMHVRVLQDQTLNKCVEAEGWRTPNGAKSRAKRKGQSVHRHQQ
eukprot:scaffold3624_cov106-Skeletonema_marinoi.AAC.4